MNPIDPFLQTVRRQLNTHRTYTAALWTLGIGAALLLVIAASYFFRGESVPRYWYLIAGVATFFGGFIAAWARRFNLQQASQFADDYFQLEDSVTSARRFQIEGKEGGFYDLQKETTEKRITEVQADAIKYPFPRILGWAAAVLLLAAVSTAFIPPSAEVLRQRAEAEATKDTSEALKEGLKDLVEDLDNELTDPRERELFDAEQLKKWVEELKATTDPKEAMRQYAALERKLAQAARRLDQRRDEKLLSKAAEELRKDAQNRQLGEKLKQQKYQDAAKQLKKMKVNPKDAFERAAEAACEVEVRRQANVGRGQVFPRK